MTQVKLKKFGGSYIFVIPPDIKEAFGLIEGNLYDITFSEVKIMRSDITTSTNERSDKNTNQNGDKRANKK
jgi:hypothetical protein